MADNKDSLFDKASYAYPTYGNLYRRLTDQQKDEIKRFTGKIGTAPFRGGVELFRMLTQPGTFPSRMEMETGKLKSKKEIDKFSKPVMKIRAMSVAVN